MRDLAVGLAGVYDYKYNLISRHIQEREMNRDQILLFDKFLHSVDNMPAYQYNGGIKTYRSCNVEREDRVCLGS